MSTAESPGRDPVSPAGATSDHQDDGIDLDHTRGHRHPDHAAPQHNTQSSVDTQLVGRADRAVRVALREGVIGPDVEQLLDWVAARRARQRKTRAAQRVTEILAEIHRAEGDG